MRAAAEGDGEVNGEVEVDENGGLDLEDDDEEQEEEGRRGHVRLTNMGLAR